MIEKLQQENEKVLLDKLKQKRKSEKTLNDQTIIASKIGEISEGLVWQIVSSCETNDPTLIIVTDKQMKILLYLKRWPRTEQERLKNFSYKTSDFDNFRATLGEIKEEDMPVL